MDQRINSFSARQMSFLSYQARCLAAGLRNVEEFERQVREELKLIGPYPTDETVTAISCKLISMFI